MKFILIFAMCVLSLNSFAGSYEVTCEPKNGVTAKFEAENFLPSTKDWGQFSAVFNDGKETKFYGKYRSGIVAFISENNPRHYILIEEKDGDAFVGEPVVLIEYKDADNFKKAIVYKCIVEKNTISF